MDPINNDMSAEDQRNALIAFLGLNADTSDEDVVAFVQGILAQAGSDDADAQKKLAKHSVDVGSRTYEVTFTRRQLASFSLQGTYAPAHGARDGSVLRQ